jgi:hypothetical protein
MQAALKLPCHLGRVERRGPHNTQTPRLALSGQQARRPQKEVAMSNLSSPTPETDPNADPYDPTNRRCATCRWHDVAGLHAFYGKNTDGLSDVGYCRRRPPAVDYGYLLRQLQHLDRSREEFFVYAVFPETAPEDWCGAWELGV